jgi:hypothetical protein
MVLMQILLLGTGLWSVWTGLKVCEQVHRIALTLTGLLVVIWGLTLAPLWIQIGIEILLVSLGHYFSNLYTKEFLLNKRSNT